jgi:putative sterol carrier protein
MATYAFLSPEWIEAARHIRDEGLTALNDEGVGSITTEVRMNLVVEEVPFESGTLDAHVDTSLGVLEIDLGHLDGHDVKVSLDYATAKAILIDGDSQAGMQAFMAGRLRVEGDMSKLLAFQSAPPSERQVEFAEKIRSITA